MLATLLDHSTISAVERLSGVAPVDNAYLIDADVAALESFVQAHLFYDQIIALDDYQQEHATGRKQRFSHFQWLDCTLFDYSGMVKAAQEEVAGYDFSVQGGTHLSGEIGCFLELLFQNIAFTWRLHSSSFWLQVSMLGAHEDLRIHRYTKTWEGLLSAVRKLDERYGDQLLISETADRVIEAFDVPSDGRTSIEPETRSFFAALAWLSQRTVLYSNIAYANGIEATLHPIRSTFRARYLGRLGLPREMVSKLVQKIGEQHACALDQIEIARGGSFLKLELPFFSAYLASKQVPVTKFVETLMELRDQPVLKDWRLRLRELSDACMAGGATQQSKIIRRAMEGLQGDRERLLRQYGVQTPQGISSQDVIAVANAGLAATGTGVSIPNLSTGWRVPLPQAVQRWVDARGRSTLLTPWISSITRVERLGALRTHLSASVVRRGSYRRKPIEDVAYAGRDSGVRRWASTRGGSSMPAETG